jgi:hypothetical protein
LSHNLTFQLNLLQNVAILNEAESDGQIYDHHSDLTEEESDVVQLSISTLENTPF